MTDNLLLDEKISDDDDMSGMVSSGLPFFIRKYFSKIIVFVFIFDSALLLTFLLLGWYFLVAAMFIFATIGAWSLSKRWNVDERTDEALDLASRETGTIFVMTLVISTVIMTIYSVFNPETWDVVVTLTICTIAFIYLQVFLAVRNELEMR